MFNIDSQSKLSIFEQIEKQIIRFIKLGIYKANDKLPSVRELAFDLGINPNTVMKAYAELESKGIIYTLPKKGAYVKNELNDSDPFEELRKAVIPLKKQRIELERLLNEVRKIYEE